MCSSATWAAVIAYACSYGVEDNNVINEVALEVGATTYSSPSAMQACIVDTFNRHGVHMV